MGRGNVTSPPPPWWELGPKYLGGNRVDMQIEIIAAIFDWISKQQLNLSLFLSSWYCRKLRMTDLPGRDRKVRSHMHFILSPYEKPQSADRGFYMNRCLIKGCYWRRRETRNMNAQCYAHIMKEMNHAHNRLTNNVLADSFQLLFTNIIWINLTTNVKFEIYSIFILSNLDIFKSFLTHISLLRFFPKVVNFVGKKWIFPELWCRF